MDIDHKKFVYLGESLLKNDCRDKCAKTGQKICTWNATDVLTGSDAGGCATWQNNILFNEREVLVTKKMCDYFCQLNGPHAKGTICTFKGQAFYTF